MSNRAQRRQAARKAGWRGTKSNAKVTLDEALKSEADKEALAEANREQAEALDRMRQAKRVNDLGIALPGSPDWPL